MLWCLEICEVVMLESVGLDGLICLDLIEFDVFLD